MRFDVVARLGDRVFATHTYRVAASSYQTTRVSLQTSWRPRQRS